MISLGAMLLSPPRKRTFWRAVGAGLIAYCVSFAVLTLLFWLLTPFVWAALYGEPYVSQPGPFSPDSGMWLVVQAIGFLVSVSAGAAAARRSPPGSYVIGGPFGVMLGAALYMASFGRTTTADKSFIA